MVNYKKWPNISENLEKSLSSLPKALVWPALVALLLWTPNVDAKTFKNDLDFAKTDTYPAFVNSHRYSPNFKIYWVGEKLPGWSYNWIWLNLHTDSFDITAEKWPKYTKWSFIWKYDLNPNVYVKYGLGYLHYKDYQVWKYKINPTQEAVWWALWAHKRTWLNEFNAEAGLVAYKLYGAKLANTTAYYKYLELAYRHYRKSGAALYDLFVWFTDTEAYWKHKTNMTWTLAGYLNKHSRVSIDYSKVWTYRKWDWKVIAWLKIPFDTYKGGHIKWGKMTPFIKGKYDVNSHLSTSFTWEKNIAYKSLQWDYKFEDGINTNYIVVQEVAPYIFSQKIKQSFEKPKPLNHAPKINSVTADKNLNELKAWDNVTFTVFAEDQDKDKLTYSYKIRWKKGETISENWNQITIHNLKPGNHTLKVIVTDEKWNKITKTITFSVEKPEPINTPPSINITADKKEITIWENATLTANAKDVDGKVVSIRWYDENGKEIWEWENVTVTPRKIGIVTYYAVAEDDDGATTQSNIITIKVDEKPEPVNHAPVINSISQDKNNLQEWDSVTFTVDAEDEDGDNLSYTYKLNGQVISGNGNRITIDNLEAGNYTLEVKVTDGKWWEVRETKNFEVKEQSPVLDSVELTKWNHIRDIIKVSDNKYIAQVNSTTQQWTVYIKFSGNKWDEIISVSWYWDAPTDTVVESTKYPWEKIIIDWDID